MKQGAADDPFADEPDPEPSPPEETAPAPDEVGPTGRVEALADVLEAQDQGEAGKVVQAWNQDLAAILLALEDLDELDSLGKPLSKNLDREPLDEYQRSDIVRLALRWAIEEIDDELIDEVRKARGVKASRGDVG